MSLRKEIIKICDCFFTIFLRGNMYEMPSQMSRFCIILCNDEQLVSFFKSCSKIPRERISFSEKAFLYATLYFYKCYDFPLLIDCILNEYKKVNGDAACKIFHAWLATANKQSFDYTFDKLDYIK